MTRLDRYLLVTSGGAFVAVLVVLSLIIWLSAALRRFDLLTSQGQTIWVFLTVTGLSLPTVMAVIAPIAVFIAILFTFYKLNSDSELIVMSAAGMSPWQLFRAPFFLSIVVAVIAGMVTADLSPRSLRNLRQQVATVNADIINKVAIPGRFASIEQGLTFHVRERGPGGLLLGIFINDLRTAGQATTYLAEHGRTMTSDAGLFLVLEQGTLHRSDSGGRNSSIVAIDRYAFDLSQIDSTAAINLSRPSFRPLSELIRPAPEDIATEEDKGLYRVELHKRLSAPLYPLAAFIIAFAFLGRARTTRQSRGLAIIGAGTAFMFVQILGLGSGQFVERSALASPLPYLIPLTGIALGAIAIVTGFEGRMPVALQRLANRISSRVERMGTT